MAGEWIKFRHSLVRDGRVRIMSRSCHADVTTILGGLVTLWCLADEHADENGVLYGYTKEDLNREIGIENFCESLPECWIDLSGEYIKLPNYQEHNGTTGKKRSQDAKRQKERRKVSRPKRDEKATREEKRREDIKESKKKKFQPPTQHDVSTFFIENGYSRESSVRAFLHYSEANWHDTTGKPVLNWKQKMRTNWFTEKNKIQTSIISGAYKPHPSLQS